MKNKQFVISTLLLLVGLQMIRCTFAVGPVARFVDIIKVPELERRLEHLILRMRHRADRDGALFSLNGDDTTLDNSAPHPGLIPDSNVGGLFGSRADPELSPINQVVGGAVRNGFFSRLLKE